MTGPEHYREAEKLLAGADEWMDADYGWKASLSREERIEYKAADLAAAQVHATLAIAAATALSGASLRLPDWNAWRDTAGTQPAAAS